MWPLEEIDECEESVADADIAGTRTTLQPAHHMTNFVPRERESPDLRIANAALSQLS